MFSICIWLVATILDSTEKLYRLLDQLHVVHVCMRVRAHTRTCWEHGGKGTQGNDCDSQALVLLVVDIDGDSKYKSRNRFV